MKFAVSLIVLFAAVTALAQEQYEVVPYSQISRNRWDGDHWDFKTVSGRCYAMPPVTSHFRIWTDQGALGAPYAGGHLIDCTGKHPDFWITK